MTSSSPDIRRGSKVSLNEARFRFIACDGSAADIFRNPYDPDTFFEPNGKSTRGFNQVHINAFYSILNRRFTNLVVQPGRKRNEYAAFCGMVDAAKSGGPSTIYFADMGYASYNNFAHVIENGQFFLIRCNDKRMGGILGRKAAANNFERVCLSEWLRRNCPEHFSLYSVRGDTVGDYLDSHGWKCSMIWSAYMGLPLSLAGVGTVQIL